MLVLVVTFRCFEMVFGCRLMVACGLFMKTTGLIDVGHDVVPGLKNVDELKPDA